MSCLITMDYTAVWKEMLADAQRWVSEQYPALDTQQAAEKTIDTCFPGYLLACFGQEARQTRAAPWAPLPGREILELMVMEKYSWTPETARHLSDNDMLLALHKEISRFKLPDEARDACRPALEAAGLETFIEQGLSPFFKHDDD
ncbi:ECs1072 family phage-associated protein [Vreelandella jeotgali]|uniref:ECs1072 family phage-associated protein n=1 Tax=Vreelandella jeotgali TaxID=553386 RepID=UPI00034799D1|nr:hypothetical protein [Halomonas jeotgali]